MIHLVTIDNTSIPDGVLRIADQLPAADVLQPGDTVTLKFTYGFVYLTGLVLLAAWRRSLPGTAHVVIDDHPMQDALPRLSDGAASAAGRCHA